MKNTWKKIFLTKRRWWLAGFMVLPFMVFYWQIPFTGGLTLGNDYVAYAINHQMELQYSLIHGTFPLYVPGFAAGQASAALTLGQLYHPISHVAAALPGYWNGLALEWNTLLRLLSLGAVHLAIFFLLSRLRILPVPAFIISFITVYNLRMLDMFRYGASLESYTGFLLLCTVTGFYYLKPTPVAGPLVIAASAYLAVCGGHPQMMYYGLLGTLIVTALLPFVIKHIKDDEIPSAARLKTFYIRTAVWITAGILTAAPYILSFYTDFIRENTARVGQSYKWSLCFTDTPAGALENFFNPLHSDVHGAFGSSALLLTILLLPLLEVAGKKIPPAIRISWGIFLLFFLCCLGNATPLHRFFWEIFPMAKNFRIPGRISMIFPVIFMFILAWIFKPRKDNNRIKPFVLLTVVSLAVYLTFHMFFASSFDALTKYSPIKLFDIPGWVVPFIIGAGLITFVLTGYYLLNKAGVRTKTLLGIVLALAIVTQVTVELRWGTYTTGKKPTQTLDNMNRIRKTSPEFQGPPGAGMEASSVSLQIEKSILEPYLAKFYRRFITARSRQHALQRMRRRNVTSSLVVETRGHRFKSGDYKNRSRDRVMLNRNTFNRFEFTVDAGGHGFLSLSFPYAPGWRAYINGSPTAVYRANGYMQAIYLTPGSHRVEFRFHSPGIVTGIVLFGITLIAMGFYFGLIVLKGKKRYLVPAVVTIIVLAVSVSWFHGLYRGKNLETRYRWHPGLLPHPNNLAYGKTACTGRQVPYCNFYPGICVDGDKRNKLYKGERYRKTFWQVDLGSLQPVGRIVIYDGPGLSAPALPLKIEGSRDGKRFYTISTITGRGKISPKKPWQIPLPVTKSRFIRLRFNGKQNFYLYEVEVYPPPRQIMAAAGQIMIDDL